MFLSREESAAINEMANLTRDLTAGLDMTSEHLDAIAAELTRRASQSPGGAADLAERKDLEPWARIALQPTFGDRVETDRKVPVPSWRRVGRVDLVVRGGQEGDTLAWVAELKWCGPGDDILYEGIWDLFKVALLARGYDNLHAYLITGAQKTVWSKSASADLFSTAVHDPEELCTRRLPDKKNTIAWDYLLRRGFDSYPDEVPVRIGTVVVGHAAVGDWELRAVEVTLAATESIPMQGGWPHGKRPADASHPKIA